MPPLKVRFANTVRSLRVAAGFSQESFAHHVKVHRTFMSSIERGRINVSLETIERLAHGLDMSAWQLIQIAEVGGEAVDPPPRVVRRRKSGKGKIAEDGDH